MDLETRGGQLERVGRADSGAQSAEDTHIGVDLDHVRVTGDATRAPGRSTGAVLLKGGVAGASLIEGPGPQRAKRGA
jgi:hypothetical protein